MTTLERKRGQARADRRIGLLMAFVAATLVIASLVHLTGNTPGGSGPPFEASDAGLAEAIIAAVLAFGAFTVLRGAPRARTAALATTAFAILGFLVGLSITVSGGDVPDVVYHAVMLQVLVTTLVLLIRSDKGARP